MLIGDIDISKLMVQKVEVEKVRDMDEFRNNKSKKGNEFRQQKVM